MKDQINTIREALECGGVSAKLDAMEALTQLEAMVGVQEPVAWAVYWGLPPTRKNSVHFDKESTQAVANQIKSATEVRPLYAAPVAQQPHECTRSHPHENMDGFCVLRTEIARLTNENARLKAQQPQARPDFTDEWTGYLKDGETPFERFLRERKDVQSALKLYQRALEENERLKAQQPQAEAVPSDLPAFKVPREASDCYWGKENLREAFNDGAEYGAGVRDRQWVAAIAQQKGN